MSQKTLRGIIPINRRIESSNRKLRQQLLVTRSPIKRCKSAPALSTVDDGGVMAQRRTCTDSFSSSHDLVLPYSHSPKIEGYNKDGKVVVNVTVEGSPGAVRTMLKLGSSVEETMEIIRKQYNSEGRTPQLDQHSLSTFELHQSYFSLHCLDKSDMIGDIGSRSFYMRKCKDDNSNSNSFTAISTKQNTSPPQNNPIIVFPDIISNSFKKIMRSCTKLSKIIGCIDK
ncbi:hypothetical protein QVD17_01949 [Tagetes erecta]|uniref:DUF7054 domain-containing protein n=1 Tax=Tagetes erecta TaxID=13708 RepID=A0AAD8P8Q3_TARER|nr:hypothetical protein QVD17_01949 [Tagetes erecta]